MINISINTLRPIGLLDYVARSVIGETCAGCSVGADKSTVHQLATGYEQQALDILNGCGALVASSDKAIVTANGIDTATITITSDNVVFYRVLADSQLFAEGATSDGVLELASTFAATYMIYLYDGTTLTSASIKIEAV
jgi:hypothetical protein